MRRQAVGDPPPNAHETVADDGDFVSVELSADRVYWAQHTPDVITSAPKDDPRNADALRPEFGGQGRLEGFRLERVLEQKAERVTLFVVTFQDGALHVWRKGPADGAPVLLGRVRPLDKTYAGNPFGAAYVLADAGYVYFADVGTFGAPSNGVASSLRTGTIYRVAR